MLHKLRKLRVRSLKEGLKLAAKAILMRLGVGAFPAGIATHFAFKYIFMPIARHLAKKRILRHMEIHHELLDGKKCIVKHDFF